MQAVDRVLPACATGRHAFPRFLSRIARRSVRAGAGLATLLLPWLLVWPAADADAAYVRRYAVTTRGAITFTGNTLGLSRDSDAAGLTTPGTRSSIGAFSTIDIGQQVGSYPAGTTSDWRLNSAAANLVLPPGAAVLHAELIWGGSIRFGGDDVSAFLNSAVRFTVPGGSPVDVVPDPASAQQTGDGSYYVRSADVTALVRAAGAGAYVAGGVPGTLGTSNTSNTAGWTLAVVYNDGAAPVRNMTVFVGAEKSGSDPAAVSGFCTPPTGPVNGRVLVTAIEGDASDTGDTFLFGRVLPLGTANRLSGPNNPITNFFSSQINGDNGLLDIGGTFGTRNHNAATHTNIVGGRQGWDITNVDGSAQLINNQSGAYAQGTTNGEAYAVAGIGIQIDAYAPSFPVMVKTVDKAAAVVGDVLTYTVTMHNSGQALARNVAFRDGVPPGTSFVPGSFTIGGVAQPGVTDPGTVVPIGDIAAGASVVASFQVRVDSVPTDRTIRNAAHWDYLYDTCRRIFVRGGVDTNEVVTAVPSADLQVSKTDNSLVYTAGSPITYTITVNNAGPDAASGFDVVDNVPAAITGTTASCVATGGNCGTDASAGNAVAFRNATLAAGGQITVTISGNVAPGTAGDLVNTANVAPGASAAYTDPDPSNDSATDIDSAILPPSADLSITKTDGGVAATPGRPITYTIVVSNVGPDAVTGATVSDTLPAAITGATWTVVYAGGAAGPASGSGNIAALVDLPVGGTATFTLTGSVAASARGFLLNTARVTPPTGMADPVARNNTASDLDALAVSTDLSITKTDGSATYTPGGSITYTMVVSNAGPSDAVGATVTDTLPQAITGAAWNVVYAGGASGPAGGGGNIDAKVNIPVGGTATFTLTGSVADTTTGGLSNTATVTRQAGATDPDPANNTATDTDASVPLPMLTVTKTATPTVFVIGRPASYSVTVSNTGAAPSAGIVTLTDALPAGITTTAPPVAAGWDCSTSTTTQVTCTTATILPPGGSATLSWSVDVGASAMTGDNAATVSGGGDPTCPGAAHCTGTVGVAIPRADLSITKTDGSATYLPAAMIGYTVTVDNAGPDAADVIDITDAVPAAIGGVTVTCAVTGTGSCGSNASVGNNVSFQGASLAVGSRLMFTVSGTIDVGATGDLANTATVMAGTGAGFTDPDLANNSATDTDTNAGMVSLSIAKSATPGRFEAGRTGTYVLAVSNAGTRATTGTITVTDPLPAGITLNGAPAGAGWDCSASTSTAVNCTTASVLPPGTGAPSIVVPVAIAADAVASVVNTASVSGGEDTACPAASRCSSTVVTQVAPMPPAIPVPLDARWMLAAMAVLFAAIRLRRHRAHGGAGAVE